MKILHVRITPKGIAVIDAIDAGLLPETEDGWDDSAFEVFWEKFSTHLEEHGYSFSHSGNKPGDSGDYSGDGLNETASTRKELLAGILGLLGAVGFALLPKISDTIFSIW